MPSEFSRRDFLKASTGFVSAAALLGGSQSFGGDNEPTQLPRYALGATGIAVSALSFGCGRFWQQLPDGQWEPILETALKHGVNYFDEADGYDFEHKNPHSEVRLGMALKGRRNSVHICSKFDERDPEKAKRTLDKILTRLQTDHLDVLMAHDVRADEKDPALMEKGIYAQMLKWKEEGLTRHVGFSSMMTDGKLLRRYIEVLNPEVVLMAINSTKHIANAREALPAAKARNCGVLAMKMLRDIVGKEGSKASELLSHGWQQSGVCSLCVGHSNVAELEDNIRTVQRLALGHPLADHRATEAKMAHLGTPEHLSWARPEYFDRGPRRA